MDATSDAEVVKQSASSMVSVFGGMFVAILLILSLVLLSNITSWNLSVVLTTLLILVITIVLWNVLKKYGNKKIRKINI